MKIVGSDTIEPNSGKLIHALRSIGYSFDQAVADIIDNSIEARAQDVLIRLEFVDDRLNRVLIADNGRGMSAKRLKEAMRFGAETEQTLGSLHKYGMGLKLASLSQGRCLTVLTRTRGETAGRVWTVDGIAEDWRCDELDPAEVDRMLVGDWGEFAIEDHGTLVIWSELDKVYSSKNGARGIAFNVLSRLRKHLGMHFHRFLESGTIRMYVDAVDREGGVLMNCVAVAPLNPFSYQEEGSGHPEYPKSFTVSLGEGQDLELNAHVWPANSDLPSYKLDGQVAARQGLYFYRNNRLIQAGGWNDGKDASEPHGSLARVAVDLPPELDALFSLDVKKSGIREPVGFADALRSANAPDGTRFSEFKAVAQKVYRSARRSDVSNHPLLPGQGLSKSLQNQIGDILLPQGGRRRDVTFEWSELEPNQFFDLDRDELVLKLNRDYRTTVLNGARGSSADAPLVKLLLYFLVESEFDSNRVSKQQRERLDRLNDSLLAAVRSMR